MSSSSSSASSSSKLLSPPDILLCGQCYSKPKKGVTFKTCAACGLVAYCCVACQTKDWKAHKAACKLNRAAKNARDEAREKDERERAEAKAKEAEVAASRGSGNNSGLDDMGSIMVALMPRVPPPPPPPSYRRYHEVHV